MHPDFTPTGEHSPTNTAVVILPIRLLEEFDFNRDYPVFTQRLKHVDGTVLFEPQIGTGICPMWETVVPKYGMKTFNQLNTEGLLIREETCPKSDLSAEAAFRAITRNDDITTIQGSVIGVASRKGWVFRINNYEQDIPVYTNAAGDIFLASNAPEVMFSTEELKRFPIVATIPIGDYIIFSPLLQFEHEDWYRFKTEVPLNVRIPYSEHWLEGMFLSKD